MRHTQWIIAIEREDRFTAFDELTDQWIFLGPFRSRPNAVAEQRRMSRYINKHELGWTPYVVPLLDGRISFVDLDELVAS